MIELSHHDPALLPTGVRWCEQGLHAFSGSECPRGCRKPSDQIAAGQRPERVATGSVRTTKTRPGAATEALLRKQLAECPAQHLIWVDYIPQMAWAIDAGRDYRADVGFYRQMLLVEVMGGAHAAGRARVKRDVERQGLAAQLGYRVLTITPEQVRAGQAVDLIEAALNAPKELHADALDRAYPKVESGK